MDQGNVYIEFTNNVYDTILKERIDYNDRELQLVKNKKKGGFQFQL